MDSSALRAAGLAAGLMVAAATEAGAATVKVTPLGSHDGEFCPLDRAMVTFAEIRESM